MILFEGLQCPQDNCIKEYFPDIYKYLKNDIIRCIGYFRHQGKMVFILPKSFAGISQDKKHPLFLEKVDNTKQVKEHSFLEKDVTKKQVTELTLWVYGAIDKYRNRMIGTRVDKPVQSDVIATSKTDSQPTTLIDHIIALRNFYERNKNLVLMIYKESNRGYNRINWAKTVRNKNPFFTKKNHLVYMDVINEKKHIHDQEELMVLYFSTMHYVQKKYGITMPKSPYFKLIDESEFEMLVDNDMVLGRLNGIKQQYFSDRMRELWHLVDGFHQELSKDNDTSNQGIGNYQDEYLLATDFDRVFEDMIDYLISDPNLVKLKTHEDNRRIDHIFIGQSIIDPKSKVYYIGDSKYYDLDHDIDSISIAKQYDYAHNIIQMVRDKANNRPSNKILEKIDAEIAKSYYDPQSHGYTITPNFFIRPMDNPKLDDFDLRFSCMEQNDESYQHKGCLFDRSTLALLHFEINFLYTLRTYTLEDESERRKAQSIIESEVRSKLLEYIAKKYDIYITSKWGDLFNLLPVNLWLGRTFKTKDGFVLAIPKDSEDFKPFSNCMQLFKLVDFKKYIGA